MFRSYAAIFSHSFIRRFLHSRSQLSGTSSQYVRLLSKPLQPTPATSSNRTDPYDEQNCRAVKVLISLIEFDRHSEFASFSKRRSSFVSESTTGAEKVPERKYNVHSRCQLRVTLTCFLINGTIHIIFGLGWRATPDELHTHTQ